MIELMEILERMKARRKAMEVLNPFKVGDKVFLCHQPAPKTPMVVTGLNGAWSIYAEYDGGVCGSAVDDFEKAQPDLRA